MAENEDRSSEDLGEEISQYRLEEARRKGQVAQSRELTGVLALLATGAALYGFGPGMARDLLEFMQEVFRTDLTARADLVGADFLSRTLLRTLKVMAVVGLPVAIVGFLVSVVASFAQVGAIFTFEPLKPTLEKIDPLKGIQKLFSMRQLWEVLRLVIKIVVVVSVIYAIMKSEILSAPARLQLEANTQMVVIAENARRIFIALIAILTIFAAIDLGLQRFQFNKGLRLTRQEAKQENKEKDGDPMIKARIRSIQRDMARKRMMQAVKKADVIVTNPTHFAVALVYDREKMAAPKVVAKGADFLAQQIKKLAADAGVPMVENVPLARGLYKSVKVGQYVPRQLYQAVAEVLAYVYRLKSKKI